MLEDKNVVKFPDPAAVEAEAAEWVARLDGDSYSAEDHAKFNEWLNRGALHRETAARMLGLWSDLNLLKKVVPHPGPALADEARWSPAQLWHAMIAMPVRSMASAASIVLMLGLAGLFYVGYAPSLAPPPVTRIYQTAVGGQETVRLADGSTVLINTDSKIEVSYSRERRTVRLLQGEAYFDVAHDDTRPFTVYSGNRVVRDIGTAFAVRLVGEAVEVTVTKGAVELTANPAPGTSAQKADQRLGVVSEGQNARFDRNIVYIKSVSKTEMKRQLAWRRGYLEYSGEPLAQVVADVSRYTDIKIELGDTSLKHIPVGGYFAIDKLETVFVALERNFGIHAEWRDASHVKLVATADTRKAVSAPATP